MDDGVDIERSGCLRVDEGGRNIIVDGWDGCLHIDVDIGRSGCLGMDVGGRNIDSDGFGWEGRSGLVIFGGSDGCPDVDG